jgi:uncharacterized protein (DUF1778 family)
MPATSSTRKDRIKLSVTKDRMVLSKRDSARVLELLKHPPSPTAALLAAARRSLARK